MTRNRKSPSHFESLPSDSPSGEVCLYFFLRESTRPSGIKRRIWRFWFSDVVTPEEELLERYPPGATKLRALRAIPRSWADWAGEPSGSILASQVRRRLWRNYARPKLPSSTQFRPSAPRIQTQRSWRHCAPRV